MENGTVNLGDDAQVLIAFLWFRTQKNMDSTIPAFNYTLGLNGSRIW